MMPGLPIYLRRCVTPNFDLWSHKLIVQCPCPCTARAKLHQNWFIWCQSIVFTSLVTHEQMNGQVLKTVPPSTCQSSQRRYKNDTNNSIQHFNHTSISAKSSECNKMSWNIPQGRSFLPTAADHRWTSPTV